MFVVRDLTFQVVKPEFGRFRSATNAIALPKPKPGAMCICHIMPAIRSAQIALGEGSRVREGEDAFQSLDFGDSPFLIH